MPTQSKEPEVILEVAGEGGGYTILGEQRDDCWRFWRAEGDSDSWLLDDDDDAEAVVPLSNERVSEPAACYFNTLEAALDQINSCWPHLRPLQVHPAFAKDIWRMVVKYWRENEDTSRTQYVLPKWSEICVGQTMNSLDELDRHLLRFR
jgi:hypothetical protein